MESGKRDWKPWIRFTRLIHTMTHAHIGIILITSGIFWLLNATIRTKPHFTQGYPFYSIQYRLPCSCYPHSSNWEVYAGSWHAHRRHPILSHISWDDLHASLNEQSRTADYQQPNIISHIETTGGEDNLIMAPLCELASVKGQLSSSKREKKFINDIPEREFCHLSHQELEELFLNLTEVCERWPEAICWLAVNHVGAIRWGKIFVFHWRFLSLHKKVTDRLRLMTGIGIRNLVWNLLLNL